MPNSQELDFSKKVSFQIIPVGFVVKTFKFNKVNNSEMNSKRTGEYKDGYKEICKLNKNQDVILHIQVPERTEFSDSEIGFVDSIQDISENPYFFVYEKSFRSSGSVFKNRLLKAKKENPKKEIVPVIDVYTEYNNEKVAVMIELGIKKCVVIYRNYKKYDLEWNELMGLLETAEIYKIVVGVLPRMRRKNRASILIAPFRYGANLVAHGIPWSGGKAYITLLDNWQYKKPNDASKGKSDYNGKSRLQVQNTLTNTSSKYLFSRIDALNEANKLLEEFDRLEVKEIESLLD